MTYETDVAKCFCFQIVFVLQAQYEPEITDFNREISLHGDFVKDVAFQVENLDYIFNYAKKQGAVVVKDLWEERDQFGVIRMATIKTVSRYKWYKKCVVFLFRRMLLWSQFPY